MRSSNVRTRTLSYAYILDALRVCYDFANPSHRLLNIVDLGMVEDVRLEADPDAPGAGIPGVPQKHRLLLTLLPTSSDQDAQCQLRAQIANRLAGLEELSQVAIVFADEPLWTPERLTPEGRRLLQLDFPILNNRVR
jgi:metal-sulfur cluster biosynthetic enzyme